MYVPEEIRNEWVELDTKKYFTNDESKRELIEEYLSTLSETNRRKAIAVMCENTNSKNYYRFLDLSTTAYTPNQVMLSNDLIKYFENKYLNEFIDRQETMKRFNQNIFNKQDELEKMNSFDQVYNETVADQHYFNPYDKNDVLTPKISNNRQFLDRNINEDRLFEIIDKNSSLYLKQQAEFNNEHLNSENVRNLSNRLFKTNEDTDRYIRANNEPEINQEFVMNTPNIQQPIYRSHSRNVNNNHPSFIVEIPKVDNIADFIEQRELLNYKNTLRKHHNINTSLEFNNAIANTNLVYNSINPELRRNRYVEQKQVEFELPNNEPVMQQQANMHEQMGSIYESNLNENMMNQKTTMQIAQENISNEEIARDNKVNNEPTINKIIKLSKNNVTNNNFDNNYGIGQLDPNANNRINQIKEYSKVQVVEQYSPNTNLFNNRFNEMNSYVNYQPSQNVTKMQQTVDQFRMDEFDRIQKFFETKPTVVKKSTRFDDEETLEIIEEIPVVERKVQARLGRTKKDKRANNNQNAIKIIKINKGVVDKKAIPIAQNKKNEKIQAKKVLV